MYTRTPKNTTLHNPSAHSNNGTDPKHNESLHCRTHLDQCWNCLFRLWRVCGCALLNLWWSTTGWVSSWSSIDLETLESDVSSGKSAGAIAKDRGWPRNSVRQRDAAVDRGDPSPRFVGGIERRLTLELLDEIREFFEEDNGRISVKVVSKATKSNHIVSYLQSKKPSAVCACVHRSPALRHLQDRHIRDRRKCAEEMLAKLALGSGRRISRKISASRRLDLDVICPNFEKIFRNDAVAPCRNYQTFSRYKWPDVTRERHHAKTGGQLLRRVILNHFS